MLPSRRSLVFGLVLGALSGSGCVADTGDGPDPALVQAPEDTVLEFRGEVDVATGTMSLRFFESGDLDGNEVGVVTQPLTDVMVVRDGVAGSGPADTAELVTTSSGVGATGDANCGVVPGGIANCFWGLVDLRHFYATRHLSNAYAQIVTIDAGYEAYDDVSNSPFGQDSTRGLWRYGTLEPNSAGYTYFVGTRRWRFRLPVVQNFAFTGRVLATLEPVGGPNAPHFASVNERGESMSGDATGGCVSDNGRFVVFSTPRALIPADTNGRADVYRADRVTGQLIVVSLRSTGALTTTGDASNACLSADGNVVVFESTATDMTATPDANGVTDIFTRSITGAATTLVSSTSSGTYPQFCGVSGDSATGIGSYRPSMSADGRYVAFDSTCARLCGAGSSTGVPSTGCIPGRPQVYRKDRQSGATTVVSAANGSTTLFAGANETAGPTRDVSIRASISNDGNRVAFESSAGGTGALVPGDGTVRDVFLRVVATATTTRISVNAVDASQARVSGDGSTVAYVSNGAQGLTDANTGSDVFRFVLAGAVTGGLSTPGTRTISSVNGAGAQPSGNATAPWISADGCRVAMSSSQALAGSGMPGAYGIYLRDACAARTVFISQNGQGSASLGTMPMISPNGAWVAFETGAINISLDGAVLFDAGGIDVFTVRVP